METPVHHPFEIGIFHYKSTIFKGYPPANWCVDEAFAGDRLLFGSLHVGGPGRRAGRRTKDWSTVCKLLLGGSSQGIVSGS